MLGLVSVSYCAEGAKKFLHPTSQFLRALLLAFVVSTGMKTTLN